MKNNKSFQMFQLIGKNGLTPSKFDRVLKMRLKSSLIR